MDFTKFMARLEAVQEETEWKKTSLKNVKLVKLDGNNPFPNFGGDEYGIGLSIDDGEPIPLRSTAIPSLILRGDVSGCGLTRLFEFDKQTFCQHLNAYYGLKPKKHLGCLALIQEGKLSALHSGSYAVIPMTGIFNALHDYLGDNYEDVEAENAEWSWEYSSVIYSIKDEYFEKVYNDFFDKYYDGKGHVKLRCISSDVAEAAVKLIPYVKLRDRTLPLAGVTSVRHFGNACLASVKDNFNKTFIKFEASCRSLGALANVEIRNAKNAMIKAFTSLRIPQKYAAPIAEQYDNTPMSALDVYIAMCECLDIMSKNCVDKTQLMRHEENLSRLVTYNINRWQDFDVPGVVAWGAKG